MKYAWAIFNALLALYFFRKSAYEGKLGAGFGFIEMALSLKHGAIGLALIGETIWLI